MTDDLAASLRYIVDLLEAVGLDYMLVGSVAALAHGRTRATQDFDVVVELNLATVEQLVEALPEDRFYVSMEAARDAVRRETLFNIIDLTTGWKVDVVPRKKRPFSQTELARRQRMEVLGVSLCVATLEDTIVSKLEWARLSGGSGRQIEDVAELLHLGGEQLDRDYVERWVAELDLSREWNRARSNDDPA